MPSAWLGMLLLTAMLISGHAHALVCLQRGELPTSESTHVYTDALPQHYKEHQHQNGLIWHIHMDVPMQCAWSDERGGELAAEQQSSQSLYVYLDPAWQDPALDAMSVSVSVDHGRSIHAIGPQLRVLKSDQHMPTFSVMRICDHHDEWGCRHWRNAPSQDYRTPISITLPVDLYIQHPLPQTRFVGRLLLQVGNNQERPDRRARLNVPFHFPSCDHRRLPDRFPSDVPSTMPVPLRKMLRPHNLPSYEHS